MISNSTFRNLHHGSELFVLPNAWDAGSARFFESLGAKAVATTSAGVAWSRGYPDGDALPIEKLFGTVDDIARVIRVPLTIDIEGGYSSDPVVVSRVLKGVIDLGVAGINIEDGASSPDVLCRKIEAARRVAVRADVDLFINARTDVYLCGLATGDAAIEEVAHRAERYRSAGCDGIFVPLLSDVRGIEAITSAIAPLPLNIMLVPGLPSLTVLRQQGVRRLSAGSAIAQAAIGIASRLATDFLGGSFENMFTNAADYSAMNKLFQSRR
jgi:2-methylisocitrate lyase-like PEP mutase family enzyme